MASKANGNPIRRFKDRHDLTYPELALRLGISHDYARKLGAPNGLRCVSTKLAQKIEARTEGEIGFLQLMRWIEAAA